MSYPAAAGFLLLSLAMTGCTITPKSEEPRSYQRCEAFFVYEICVADLDRDGQVDFIYFDDTAEIFMFERSLRSELEAVRSFHTCAIAMSASTRDYSSQLLYSEGLGIAQRLRLKGKLIKNYRMAQPAVAACNDAQQPAAPRELADDPFLADENWDEGAI